MGNASHLPKWVCSGLVNPEKQTVIRLNTSNNKDAACNKLHGRDITNNHVVVELRPHLIGIMFNREESRIPEYNQDSFFLSLHDPGHRDNPDYCFGKIGLRYYDSLVLDDYFFVLFITTYSRNFCLSPLRIQSHYLYERVFLFFENDPHNYHKMKPHYLFNNWLIYSLPRAVALVSFDDGKNSNMYPMDLIGPTDSPYYILSLTTIYPSVPYLLKDKRLAVGHMPLNQIDNVYAMGKNNKRISVPREELIVETALSPVFSIPVPVAAINIRELDIVTSFEVCYHTIIIAKTRNFVRNNEDLHFCHVQRIYQRYLMDQNRPLPYVVRQYKRPE